MRKAMVVMVGIVTVLGFVVGPPYSEAVDSCTLNGNYSFSALGEAGGFIEVMGIFNFNPFGGCTGGDFTADLTLKRQGGAGAPVVVAGTYFVGFVDERISLTVPGVIGLTGLPSQVAGGVANAFNFVARFEQGEPIVLAGSAFRQTLSGSAGVSEVEIVSNETSINNANPKFIFVDCPGTGPGRLKVLGGGARVTGSSAGVSLNESIPNPAGAAWSAGAEKLVIPGGPVVSPGDWGLRVFAVCAKVQ